MCGVHFVISDPMQNLVNGFAKYQMLLIIKLIKLAARSDETIPAPSLLAE